MALTPGESIPTTQSAGAQSLDGWFRDTPQSNAPTTAAPAPASGGLNAWFDEPKPVAQQRGGAPAFSPISSEALDQVATAEGLTPRQRQMMGVLLEQESGSGRNAKTSVDGARGAGQILPATFQQYAKPGERIDDPASNLAVAARIIKDLGTKSGDDPARIATGYFSGPGNMNSGAGDAWRNDAADGNGKRVSSYVGDVLARLAGAQSAVAAESVPQANPIATAPKWAAVTAKPEYQALSDGDKQAAREAYFQRFIAPNINPGEEPKYREWFDKQTAPPAGPGIVDRTVTALGGAREAIREAAGTTDEQQRVDKLKRMGLDAGVMTKFAKETDTPNGQLPKQLQAIADLPATDEFKQKTRDQWAAADPATRKTLEQAGGYGGFIAKQLNSIYGDAKIPTSAQVQGESRIEKTDFDFDAQKAYNDPKSLLSNPVVRGAVKGVEGYRTGSLGLAQFAADALGADDFAAAMKQQAKVSGNKTAAMGESGNFVQRNFEGAVSSIAQQLPALVGGAATGSEALVLGSMFAQTFGQEYGQAREAGKDMSDAAQRAAIFGSFEVAGEKLGLGEQFRLIRQAARGQPTGVLAGWLANTAKKELPGELFTTTGEFLTDKAESIGLNKDASFKDYLDQMADTAVQTFMQSGVMGAGVHAGGAVADSLRSGSTRAADAAEAARGTALNRWMTDGLSPSAAAQHAATGQPAPAVQAAPATGRVEPTIGEEQPAPPTAAAIPAQTGTTGIADQDVLDYADSRYRQLVAQRDGEIGPVEGDSGDIIEGQQAGAELSADDAAELALLQQNRGDARALARQYGFDTSQPDSATVAAAANEAATSPENDRAQPTQAQKEAGNYKKGSVTLHGLDLAIENPQGSSRSGVSRDGRAWSNTLADHYGYVRGTVGADGDGVDVFVGPHPQSTKVFVIDQIDPETGRFDEVKAMLGYDSQESANAAYHANHEAGWNGMGHITEVPVDGFKAWLDKGDTSKAFGSGQFTPAAGEVPEAAALVQRQRDAMANYKAAAMSGDEAAAQAAGDEVAAARAALNEARMNVANRAQTMLEEAAAAPAPKPKTEKQAREQRAAKTTAKESKNAPANPAVDGRGSGDRAAVRNGPSERARPGADAALSGQGRGNARLAGEQDATDLPAAGRAADRKPALSDKQAAADAKHARQDEEVRKAAANIAARAAEKEAAKEQVATPAQTALIDQAVKSKIITPGSLRAERFRAGIMDATSDTAPASAERSYLEGHAWALAKQSGAAPAAPAAPAAKPKTEKAAKAARAEKAPKPKKSLADQRPAKADIPDLNNIEHGMTDANLADLGMGFTVVDGKLLRNGEQVGRIKVSIESGPKEIPHVRVADIGVTSKGNGTGTMALAAVMGKASQFGLPVGLTTEAGLGKDHQERLRAYYERMGFRKNTGADKIKSIPEEYVWQPQVNDIDLTQDGPLARESEPVRVNTLAKLKALEKKREAGKLTDAEYQMAIQSLIGKLETRNDAQQEKKARPRERGELWLRERLLRAKRTGELSADQVDFALWALDQNPNIANDLGISLRESKGDGVAGSYIPGSRIINLVKGNGNMETVVHEIMHHTERMMPPAVQQGIVTEWSRAMGKAWKNGTPAVREALQNMMLSSAGDKMAHEAMMKAFRDKTLNFEDHYQLANASEYWAVNASEILAKRADAAGRWVAQARQWLREMIEKIKNLLNLPSSAPVLAGLQRVLDGQGKRLSNSMLVEISNSQAGAVLDGIAPQNGTGQLNSLDLRTAAQKAQAQLVDEFGKPTFSNIDWWDKSIGTQYHKAAKNPLFKKVFDLAIKRENAVSLTAVRAASLAPGFLPRIDDFMGAMRTLAQGRRTGTQTDLAGKALLEGTLDGTSVIYGKVWTAPELRAKGLNDQGIALYRQAREAIDASLEEVAAAEGYSTVHSFVPKSIREQVIDDPRGAQSVLSAALAKRIQLDELHLAAQQRNGASPAAVDAAKAKLMQSYDVRDTLAEIFDRADQLKRAGYTPLMRFGNYYVQVEEVDPQTGKTVINPDTGKPNTLYFSRFETEAEASDAYFREQVANRGKDNIKVSSGPVNDEAFKMYSGISPETLELFADVVGAKEATEKFYQVALSERSALKRRITRDAIEGYSENMPRVLANFITSNGKFAAQRYYNRDINNAIRYIPRLQGDVQKEAVRLKEYIDNPGNGGAIASALSFTWFLGGNIASALVNATQPVMMTLPYLSQFGAGRAAAALTRAAPYAMGRKQIMDTDLKAALKRGSQEGKVDAQEIFHLYSVGIQGVASILSGKLSKLPLVGSKVKGASESARARMNALGTLWGMPFAMVEGFNRRLTFIAAWDVAKSTGNPDPYQFAVDAVDQTQGVYNKVNRPNWARGPVGRVVFTFAQFKIMNVEMLKRLATMGGPEGKKAAAMYLATLILVAGLAGVPYADDVDDIIDTVGQWLGYNTNMKRTKREWAYKTLGRGFGDLALYGVSAHLPVDIGGRMGLGNMFPATGILKPSGEGNRAQDIMELGGPAISGLGKQIFDAYDAASMGNYGKAAMTMMPTAVKNAATGVEMAATGKAKDMKGRVKTDVTVGEAVAKGIGLNPTVVAEKNRANMPINQDLALQKLVESSIVDQWAQGAATGNKADIDAAMARMKNWNEKNPETPVSISAQQLRAKVKTLMTPTDTRLLKGAPKEMRARVVEGLKKKD